MLIALFGAVAVAAGKIHQVPCKPNSLGQPLDSFVSYSIEFSSFPDFAGNKSAPNRFSANLINNIGAIIGGNPRIRVGGNTQDYALYNASQTQALIGIVDPARSSDYPTAITIGPAYFESYYTWPGTKYSHGLNLALGANSSAGLQTLIDTVPLACRALSDGRLNAWEYGNEPDLYSTSSQGPVRPPTWNESTYVWQWLNGTSEIERQIERYCPEMARQGQPLFMAPSFAGTGNTLKAPVAWADGLDRNRDIEYFSTHNYISGATSPGVTLQGTLMNHTITMRSVDTHIAEYNGILSNSSHVPPLIFGECNSLYNEGRPGLSDTFGAALWGVDFNLYSASVGFKRVHMHQGTNYRYQSWQPVDTNVTTIGTKAPYYGNIAVASMLKGFDRDPVSISDIPLSSDAEESAYAAHYMATARQGSSLSRIMVVNMHSYNTTIDGAGLVPDPNAPQRPVRSYTFSVDGALNGRSMGVQRLFANGSDAITGMTFDGMSYNYELRSGLPVRLHNVTTGERVAVRNGQITVMVPDSSAALLSFE